MSTSTTTVRVSVQTRDRLAAQARERGMSISALLAELAGRADREAMVMPGVAGLMVVPKSRLKSPEKLFVFSAGQGDQFANQYKERGHRLFGYWLIRGLTEGKTQLADLAGYVQEHVTEVSLRIGPEFRQEPEMMGQTRVNLR